MTRAAKEVILVLLAGAGVFYILWGAFATKPVPGTTTAIAATDWKAIGIGLGILVLTAAFGFLVRPKGRGTAT